METAPTNTTVGKDVPQDVKVVIGGTEKPAGSTTPTPTPSVPISGGSSGGGGGTITPPTTSPSPDTTAPVISEFTQDKVVKGGIINITVNEKSKVYFVKSWYASGVGGETEIGNRGKNLREVYKESRSFLFKKITGQW